MKSNPGNSKNHSLKSLFIKELNDIYVAEQISITHLPKIMEAITSVDLKEAVEEHLDITETQVTRLDEVFSIIGGKPTATKSTAMQSLIEEGDELIKEIPDSMVSDAAIIASLQKIKHYEIASYGCLRTWAKVLGYGEAAELLQTTLDEEGETDVRLTEIAEASINEEALIESEKK